MKAQRKALEAAHGRFNAAETEAIRLRRRVDEIGTKLAHARSARARLQQDVAGYATSDEPLDVLAGRARTAARDATIKRSEVDAEIQFLESAEAEAAKAWNAVRARIAIAEREIKAAQEAYSGAHLAALIDELWQSNRSLLRKIVDAAHTGSYVHSLPDRELARLHATYRIEQVIEAAIAPAFTSKADADPEFYVGLCDATALVPASPLLNPDERTRITASASENAIASALSAVPPADEETPFDLLKASNQLTWIEHQIAGKESTLAEMKAQRGRWSFLKADESIAQGERDLTHLQAQRDRWRELIAANRPAQAA